MEYNWIKNLAQSYFDKGEWHLPDPSAPKYAAVGELSDTMGHLLECTEKYISIFNLQVGPTRQIKAFRMSSPGAGEGLNGFLLFCQRLQIEVKREGSQILTKGILIAPPHGKEFAMRRFCARHDNFGELFWVLDERHEYDVGRMAKQILEDTCRLAFEIGLWPRR